MFEYLKNKSATFALNRFKEKLVNPDLEGIAVVKELAYRDKKVFATIQLAGLENMPLEIVAEEIAIAPDGQSVRINKFDSNLEFARNALNRFAVRDFVIEDKKTRLAVLAMKKALGL